jgi:hypothetical protein
VKKRGAKKSKTNLLDLIPVRNIKWEKKEGGLIVLLKPKFKLAFLKKYVLPRLKNPYFRIKLDPVGSFIWEQCDGRLRVEELAKILQDRYGEDVEPVYDRLALFLHSLEKNHLISYKEEDK